MAEISYLEIRRKILHILVGITIILVIIFFQQAKLFLLIILLIGFALSFISLRVKVPVIYDCLCTFERSCNKNFPGVGVIYFILGSLLSLILFPKNIALASVLVLTFADPISHFIGSNFGRVNLAINKRKNIEGTGAGIVLGTILASFLVSPIAAFLGSFFAMLFELAEIYVGNLKLDDNLLIPLIAGSIMYLVYLL